MRARVFKISETNFLWPNLLIVEIFIKNRSVGVIMSKQDLLPRDRAESDPAGSKVFWGGFPTCLETKVVGECIV